MQDIKIELNMSIEHIFRILEDKVRQSYARGLDDIEQKHAVSAAEQTEAIGDIAYFAERIQVLAYGARRRIVEEASKQGYTGKTTALLRHEGRYPLLAPSEDLDKFAQRRGS